jgi:hypothetical protein
MRSMRSIRGEFIFRSLAKLVISNKLAPENLSIAPDAGPAIWKRNLATVPGPATRFQDVGLSKPTTHRTRRTPLVYTHCDKSKLRSER